MAREQKVQVEAREQVEPLRAEDKSYRPIALALAVSRRMLMRHMSACSQKNKVTPNEKKRAKPHSGDQLVSTAYPQLRNQA